MGYMTSLIIITLDTAYICTKFDNSSFGATKFKLDHVM